MFSYFYHEIIRKTTIGFGSLFNNIYIRHKNSDGQNVSSLKVPIEYGPRGKFIARLQEAPEDLNNPVRVTLPRMSFEFTDLVYDPERKVAITQKFCVKGENGETLSAFMPVPYNLNFELNIYTKTSDDMFQVIEQILPYFQPSFAITLKIGDVIQESKDIPFILNNISIDDNYVGDYEERRALIYTLNFTAKTYMLGAVSNVTGSIVKKASIGFKVSDSRYVDGDISINTTPTASKSYTNNIVTQLSEDIEVYTVRFSVDDASSLSVFDHITIDNETLRILEIDGNALTVQRGAYSTELTKHVLGTDVKLIVDADNELIEFGDPFGVDITWH